MRKYVYLFVGILIAGIASAQNLAKDYGAQLPNGDFESDWKKYTGGNKKLIGTENISGNEPYCWHSFMSAKGSVICLKAMSTQIDKRTDKRPGSKGSYSVRLTASSTLGIVANGSLTNGRMYCGSTSATSDDNHLYTDRGTDEFNMPISVVPDSITVWLCFYAQSDGSYAAFHAAVHGDSNFILYSGKDGDASQQVADANFEYTRTTTSGDNLQWIRASVPFLAKGTCTTPKYLLVSMSTNKKAGGGSEKDWVIVDDIVLIYNPTLTTGTLATTEYEADASETIAIDVPFTLTGSMSVSNLNAAPNQVIAQLSDASGSFDNPTEIGRVTTNTSGTVSAIIPASVKDGKYKVRVVSTNYPMTAEPSQSEITIRRYCTISFTELEESIATLTGNGKYYFSENSDITVSATSNSDEYVFQYWFENGSALSLEPTYTFPLDVSHELTAVFKKQFQVSIEANGHGTVSTEGGLLAEGSGVSVTAVPDEGYSFINWTVDGEVVSTNATYTFVVSESVNIVANFAKAVSISATVNIDGAGAISGAGVYTLENAEEVSVTLYAVPNDENIYKFVSWTENGEIVSTSSSYEFMASENRTLVANFEKVVQITVLSSDETCVATGSGAYAMGSTVTLFAMAEGNTSFVGWFEADTLFSSLTSVTLLADADRTFIAVFGQVYTVTVQMNIDGAAQIIGAGTYPSGAFVGASVVPNEGFDFVNWTIQGEEVSAEPTYSFTADSSVTLVANFAEKQKYTINAVADVISAGTVVGSGTYYEGTEITIEAIPNNGYDFINWIENDKVISTELAITFNALEDRNLVAHFEANFEGFTVSLNVEEGGVVFGAGLYEAESAVTVTAEPRGKYSFISWIDSEGNELSAEPSYTFTITADVELTAVFERYYSKYVIEVVSANEDAGTVEGSGKYTEDDEVTVTAVPNEGYRFLRWSENGEEISTSAEYTFVCAKKLSLLAEFKKIYSVQVDEFEGGSVKGLSTGVFDENEQVTLVVSVDENYNFVAWKDATTGEVLSENVIYSFVASADRHLAVEVKEKGKLCTVSVQTGGTVSGLRNGQYEAGETVTLIATPSEGYLFKGWISNGEIISTETRLSFVASDDMNIYASFLPKPKEITVEVNINDETFGSVIGAGTYTEGDEIMLIATPAAGYEFVGWTKDSKQLSNLTTLYYVINESCTIEAVFRYIEKEETAIDLVEHSISIYPNPVSTVLHVAMEEQIERIRIISLNGTVVCDESSVGYEFDYYVQGLRKGLYVVETTVSDTVIRKQIVVK